MKITLPDWLRRRLLDRCTDRMLATDPDFLIGDPENPYIRRWHIWRVRWLSSLYLHQILRSDDDRALHDHPWATLSIILDGGYIEVTPRRHASPGTPDTVTRWHAPGSLIARGPRAAHRLVLPRVPATFTITLFLTGPVVRKWGFWCPRGWVPWQEFTDPENPGLVGPGCGD